MEFEFRNDDLERLYLEGKSGQLPEGVVKAFARVMANIDAAIDERTLRGLKGLRYEKLSGARSHQRSLRLNRQCRLIVEVAEGEKSKKIIVVSIEDYH